MTRFDQNNDAPVVANEFSGANRRQHQRYRVDYFLRAVERSNEIVLGQVLDLSLGGMLISRPTALKPYRVIDCVLEASLESGTRVGIPAQCLTVWCRPDEFGTGFTAGFRFIVVDKGKLQALIDTLG